jgi:hypothetical protein
MPLYFFHVRDGYSQPDDEGTELPDIYIAQREAIRMSGEILREMAGKSWDGTEWKLSVSDECGKVLFVLRFSAEEEPIEVDATPAPDGEQRKAPNS